MKTNEFLREVQNRGHLRSRDEAMEATRATLAVLGQRLYGGEAKDLAAQLPAELQSYLKEGRQEESFGIDEFFKRVSQKEGTDVSAASEHARAVISVICDTVAEGEIEDIRSQLPKEYERLFGSSQTRH